MSFEFDALRRSFSSTIYISSEPPPNYKRKRRHSMPEKTTTIWLDKQLQNPDQHINDNLLFYLCSSRQLSLLLTSNESLNSLSQKVDNDGAPLQWPCQNFVLLPQAENEVNTLALITLIPQKFRHAGEKQPKSSAKSRFSFENSHAPKSEFLISERWHYPKKGESQPKPRPTLSQSFMDIEFLQKRVKPIIPVTPNQTESISLPILVAHASASSPSQISVEAVQAQPIAQPNNPSAPVVEAQQQLVPISFSPPASQVTQTNISAPILSQGTAPIQPQPAVQPNPNAPTAEAQQQPADPSINKPETLSNKILEVVHKIMRWIKKFWDPCRAWLFSASRFSFVCKISNKIYFFNYFAKPKGIT